MQRSKGNTNPRGQGLIEYALIITLLALAVIGGLTLTGQNTSNALGSVASAIPGEFSTGTPPPTEVPIEIRVKVTYSSGKLISDAAVLAFDAEKTHRATVKTDTSGIAIFSDLPSGAYVFRADHNGQDYWSDTITSPQQTQTTITITEKLITVHVTNARGDVLNDVPVYAFNSDDDYTGLQETTGKDGSVTFTLPDGSYKFRADYKAQATWSEKINTATTTSVTIRVPVAPFSVHVDRRTGGGVDNVPVYAFNADGKYTGINVRTNATGVADMELPNGNYKFRADYGGKDYWSNEVLSPDSSSVTILVGGVNVTVHVANQSGTAMPNQTVYLYDNNGNYLEKSGTTDNNGNVVFELEDASYRFRTDYNNNTYWSDTILVPTTTATTIKVSQSGLTITVTDDKKNPLGGIAVYVFRFSHGQYEYTGFAVYSDSNGQASFDLNDGDYRILAYDFSRGEYEWSQTVKIPKDTSVTIRLKK